MQQTCKKGVRGQASKIRASKGRKDEQAEWCCLTALRALGTAYRQKAQPTFR